MRAGLWWWNGCSGLEWEVGGVSEKRWMTLGMEISWSDLGGGLCFLGSAWLVNAPSPVGRSHMREWLVRGTGHWNLFFLVRVGHQQSRGVRGSSHSRCE